MIFRHGAPQAFVPFAQSSNSKFPRLSEGKTPSPLLCNSDDIVISSYFRLLDTKVMSSTYLFKDNIQFNSLDEMTNVLESPLYSQVQIGKVWFEKCNILSCLQEGVSPLRN